MIRTRRALFRAGLLAVLLSLGAPVHAQDNRRYYEPGLILDTSGRTATCDDLAFTADGKFLLAVGDDKLVRAWPFADGKLDVGRARALRWMIYREQRGAIYAMALSPDEEQRYVAIAGNGMVPMAVAVLDRSTGKVVSSWMPAEKGPNYKYADYPVRALAFSPSGKQIALGNDGGHVWVWDWKRDRPARYLGRHTPLGDAKVKRIRLVGYDEAGLLAVSADGQVRRWKTQSQGSSTELLRLKGKDIRVAALSRDRKWLAAGAQGKVSWIELCRLDGKPGGQHRTFPDDTHVVRSLAFSPDSETLAAGISVIPRKQPFYKELGGKVFLYSVSEPDARPRPGPTTSHHPEALAFHPSGKYLAIAGGDNHEVAVWEVGEGVPPARVSKAVGPGTCLWAVALSKDGKLLGFKDRRDPQAKSPNQRGKGPWRVFDLERRAWARKPAVFVPVAQLETAGGWKVKLVPDSPTGWKVVSPLGKSYPLPLDPDRDLFPRCYTFLQQGQRIRLAVGHYYGVSLFELGAGEPWRSRVCLGHACDVMALATSADGKLLVTASRDQTIAAFRLGDWPSQAELGAAFRVKDGRLIATAVDAGSPAWEAGLIKGEEILVCAIGNRYLFDPSNAYPASKLERINVARCFDLLKHARPSVEVRIDVQRQGEKTALLTTVRQRPLWQFFPTRDGEWVLWRWRDYYYDCSTRGDQYVGWQMSQGLEKTPRFYRAERFRKEFHDPVRVQQMLADTATAPDRVAVPEMQPPRVLVHRVSTHAPRPGQDVVVEFSVKPRGSAIAAQPSQVNVWVNDHLFKPWTVVPLPFKRRVLIPYAKLRHGSNTIVVQAYNQGGAREDSGRETVERAEPAKERRLLGLMVGVSKYNRRELRLPYAAQDAIRLRAAWAEQAPGKLYDRVLPLELLTDGDAAGKKVLAALKRLQDQVKDRPDDTVVLFLSGHGHGKKEEGVFRPGTWHFLASDYSLDRESATSLSGLELYRRLAAMPCRKLLLLDTCHSGASADVIRDLTPDDIGPAILTASRANEASMESPLFKGGLFTHALLQALGKDYTTADTNRDGMLSPREMAVYVERRLPELVGRLRKEVARQVRLGEVDKEDEEKIAEQTPQFQAGNEREATAPVVMRPPPKKP
jgi:WD40 repeat protein/uncharacterized caspase-like protein